MAAEANLERAIARWCKAQGLYTVKMHGSVYGMRGMPDRLIFVPRGETWAIALFVECKAPGKKVTPLQAKRLRELRSAGVAATVVWSLDDLKLAISRLRSMHPMEWNALYNTESQNKTATYYLHRDQ